MLPMYKPLAAALLATFASAASLPAQGEGAPTPPSRCNVVPDSVRPPTPAQVADRAQLRERVAAVFRADGHAPAGLLYVDIDSTRRGKVMFLDLDLPPETVSRATQEVATHLQTLESGRAYHSVVRIDGEYPVIAPGKRHCVPALTNRGDVTEMGGRLMQHHPMAGKVAEAQAIRATLILVIDRTGKVPFASLERPTGDEFMDQYAAEFVQQILKFEPASLDGVPFDVRTRFNLTLHIPPTVD